MTKISRNQLIVVIVFLLLVLGVAVGYVIYLNGKLKSQKWYIDALNDMRRTEAEINGSWYTFIKNNMGAQQSEYSEMAKEDLKKWLDIQKEGIIKDIHSDNIVSEKEKYILQEIKRLNEIKSNHGIHTDSVPDGTSQ